MIIMPTEEFQCRREFPDDEEWWTTLVFHGVPRHGYLISTFGNATGRRGKRLPGRFKSKRSTHEYASWGYSLGYALGQNGGRHIAASGLVAEAFKPPQYYPPELYGNDELKDYDKWKYHLESLSNMLGPGYAATFFVIDHKDDNPANNHVNNLWYLPQRDNNEYRKLTVVYGLSKDEAIQKIKEKRLISKPTSEVNHSTLEGFFS